VIIGGAGADQLTGGAGSDTFKYRSGDASAVDTITDFNSAATVSGGDVLDISDLLIGAPTLTGANVGQYLDIRDSGSNSIISIDRDGAGSQYGFQDFAVLSGVTGLNLSTLLTNGNIDWNP
jgi:Ca2+-binding RTX toxin-like protein